MECVDYHDTFTPITKLVTVRILLTIATKKYWVMHQIDMKCVSTWRPSRRGLYEDPRWLLKRRIHKGLHVAKISVWSLSSVAKLVPKIDYVTHKTWFLAIKG